MNRVMAAAFAFVLPIASAAGAAPVQDWTRTETRQDCAAYNPLRSPFFGETHIHTGHSLDAAFVRVRTTPRDAYQFAKGAAIGLPPYDAADNPTRSALLRRPLDFTAITDHAENFGESVICFTPGLSGYDSTQCQDLRARLALAPTGPQFPPPSIFVQFLALQQDPNPVRFDWCGVGGANCLAEGSLLWQDVVAAAEEHYDRTSACTFTSFVGYEWTANTNGWNLHRNIIFRNDDVPAMPTSYFEAPKVQQLWDSLVQDCSTSLSRCEFLTIPHGPNASGGFMFVSETADGTPLDRAGAVQRSKYEPLVEIFQNKGGSECRTGLGNNDEACGFEQLERAKLFTPAVAGTTVEWSTQMRNVLKVSLLQERLRGGNPFRLGFIGSPDGHTSTPGYTNEEDVSATGSNGAVESLPEWRITDLPPTGITANPGGLAVLWAEENSRDALFAAMKRREAYATSGTRPIVRFFAGNYPTDLCSNPAFVEAGYNGGVPMGGEFGPLPGNAAPRFAVMATKDPGGNGAPSTPLQRIQIIKGWVDGNDLREAVYDVAGDANNGASVDLATCTPTGTGFDSLCTVWEDPDFDPAQHAFYYARILENPTCRWHMYVCKQLGVDYNDPATITADNANCCLDNIEDIIQERAWTSPVWYRPDFFGIVKGKIKFGKRPNEDKLKLGVEYSRMNPAADPSTGDVVIVLRDNDDILNATIPAAAIETKKAGAKWLYKDKAGTISGIKKLKISVSGKGKGKIKLTTVKTDLSAADPNAHDIELSVSIGDISSTGTRAWTGDASKLATVKL